MSTLAIAVDYWQLKPDATLLDVIYTMQSDETSHCFMNHMLANLNPGEDVNLFMLGEPDMLVKGVKASFSCKEAAQYMVNAQKKVKDAGSKDSGAPV
jgi:ubiquinol oxidase